MDAVSVVIVLERIELRFQIGGIPEQDVVEILAADRSDQPFDEGMGDGHVRYRFDLLDAEDLQVGPPSVKCKQRIVIGTEIPRDTEARDGAVKHSTQCRPIDVPGLDRKPDNPPAELIHNHQHPVGVEPNRFAAKQIDTP